MLEGIERYQKISESIESAKGMNHVWTAIKYLRVRSLKNLFL